MDCQFSYQLHLVSSTTNRGKWNDHIERHIHGARVPINTIVWMFHKACNSIISVHIVKLIVMYSDYLMRRRVINLVKALKVVDSMGAINQRFTLLVDSVQIIKQSVRGVSMKMSMG